MGCQKRNLAHLLDIKSTNLPVPLITLTKPHLPMASPSLLPFPSLPPVTLFLFKVNMLANEIKPLLPKLHLVIMLITAIESKLRQHVLDVNLTGSGIT